MLEHATIPCELCGRPTLFLGTKRCDRCWELEMRIRNDPLLALKILDAQTVEVCPNDSTVAHFKCGQCGEEWFEHKAAMAHTNQRLAPEVRRLKAELAAMRALVSQRDIP